MGQHDLGKIDAFSDFAAKKIIGNTVRDKRRVSIIEYVRKKGVNANEGG